MSYYKRDVIVGIIFIAGLWGFISGQFIISSALFGSAAVLGTLTRKQYK
jgi:hypothetical protein